MKANWYVLEPVFLLSPFDRKYSFYSLNSFITFDKCGIILDTREKAGRREAMKTSLHFFWMADTTKEAFAFSSGWKGVENSRHQSRTSCEKTRLNIRGLLISFLAHSSRLLCATEFLLLILYIALSFFMCVLCVPHACLYYTNIYNGEEEKEGKKEKEKEKNRGKGINLTCAELIKRTLARPKPLGPATITSQNALYITCKDEMYTFNYVRRAPQCHDITGRDGHNKEREIKLLRMSSWCTCVSVYLCVYNNKM